MIDVFVFIIASLLTFLVIRVVMVDEKGKYHDVILLGMALRMSLLLITCLDFLPLPDAHEDADNFHDISVANQHGYDGYSSNYTVFLTLLYHFTDCSRWFAQFLNMILGVLVLVYLRRILVVLEIENIIAKRIMLVASFMPFLNVYSVVLMREAWVTFFTIFSLYHYICWYLGNKNSVWQVFLTISGVILASWMHAGVIGLLIGFFLSFLTYYRKNDCVRISSSSYIALFFVFLFLIFFILNFETFGSKLSQGDVSEYAEAKSQGAGGGSDYLTWLDLSSPIKLLMFAPLKMFYFLYSPIIIDWRGINDIAAFLLDSSVYLISSWFVFRKKVVGKYKLLKRYIGISYFITILLFSFGTSNSGTAIRHRAKTCPVLLVLCAISVSYPEKNVRCKQIKVAK